MTEKSDLQSNTNLVTWCFLKQPTLKLNNHQRNLMTKDTVHSKSSKRKDLHHIASNWTNRGVRSIPSSMNAYFIHTTRVISHLRNKHHHLPLRLYLMLKKQKWNMSSTPNVSEIQSITSFTGKDSHTRKTNGFLSKNLPMCKW